MSRDLQRYHSRSEIVKQNPFAFFLLSFIRAAIVFTFFMSNIFSNRQQSKTNDQWIDDSYITALAIIPMIGLLYAFADGWYRHREASEFKGMHDSDAGRDGNKLEANDDLLDNRIASINRTLERSTEVQPDTLIPYLSNNKAPAVNAEALDETQQKLIAFMRNFTQSDEEILQDAPIPEEMLDEIAAFPGGLYGLQGAVKNLVKIGNENRFNESLKRCVESILKAEAKAKAKAKRIIHVVYGYKQPESQPARSSSQVEADTKTGKSVMRGFLLGFESTGALLQMAIPVLKAYPVMTRAVIVGSSGLVASALIIGAKLFVLPWLDKRTVTKTEILSVNKPYVISKVVLQTVGEAVLAGSYSLLIVPLANNLGLLNVSRDDAWPISLVVMPIAAVTSFPRIYFDLVIGSLAENEAGRRYLLRVMAPRSKLMDTYRAAESFWLLMRNVVGGATIFLNSFGGIYFLYMQNENYVLLKSTVIVVLVTSGLLLAEAVEVKTKDQAIKSYSREMVTTRSLTSQLTRDLAKMTLIADAVGDLDIRGMVMIVGGMSADILLKTLDFYFPKKRILTTLEQWKSIGLNSFALAALIVNCLEFTGWAATGTLLGVGLGDVVLRDLAHGYAQRKDDLSYVVTSLRSLIKLVAAAGMVAPAIDALMFQHFETVITPFARFGITSAVVLGYPALVYIGDAIYQRAQDCRERQYNRVSRMTEVDEEESENENDQALQAVDAVTPTTFPQRMMVGGIVFIVVAGGFVQFYEMTTTFDDGSDDQANLMDVQKGIVLAWIVLVAARGGYNAFKERIFTLGQVGGGLVSKGLRWFLSRGQDVEVSSEQPSVWFGCCKSGGGE